MKGIRLMFVAFLAGIAAFSVFKYFYTLKEKYDLQNSLNQAKEQIISLETEKQGLLGMIEKEREEKIQISGENAKIKADLYEKDEKLSWLRKAIDDLNSQLLILKAQNKTLIEEQDNLNLELSAVAQEKEGLRLRLSSLAELKKAIRELKLKMRKAKPEYAEAKLKDNPQRIIEGNRGFLIRDGKSTRPAVIKIEVNPIK